MTKYGYRDGFNWHFVGFAPGLGLGKWSSWRTCAKYTLTNLLYMFRGHKWAMPEIDLRNYSKYNQRCYCPVGSTNRVGARFAGWGFWLTLTRWPTTHNCPSWEDAD